MTDTWPADTPQAMARWLLARLDRIRRHEAGAEIAAEIRDLAATLRRASDRGGVEKVYAGLCGSDGARECPEPLYARPGATSTVCGVCGTVHDVQERREQMREAVMEMVLPAPEAAAAVTALWGRQEREDDGSFTWAQITAAAVRGMAKRKRLVPHAHDTRRGAEVPLYRVGDVLAELARREETSERKSA